MLALALIAQWTLTPADTVGMQGWFPSLALDASDNPHIAYGEESPGLLAYVYWDGFSWQKQTFDFTAGPDNWFTSIEVDSQGRPHIASVSYLAIPRSEIWYTYWDGSSWHSEKVDTVNGLSNVWEYLSLDLDSQDRPHIAYYANGARTLRYAYWDGSVWQIQTVDPVPDVGQACSIALDSQDRPHISYYDFTNGDLKYAYWNGSTWAIQAMTSAADIGQYTSIAIDSQDRPHIAFSDVTNTRLRYTYWDGITWQTQTVQSGIDVLYPSIALDSLDMPHIAYRVDASDRLRYAYWDGVAWQKETVDGTGYPCFKGTDRYIRIGSDNCPRIAYHREMPEDLFYAYRDCEPVYEDIGEEASTGEVVFRALDRGIYLFVPGEAQISLDLYDASGRLVQNLWDGLLSAGGHTFIPGLGERGVYIAVLRYPGGTQTVKVVK
jgi:hypothetical protein